MCNVGNTLEETPPANEPPVPPTANELEIVHASENSVRFFKDELRGVGIKNLVSRAQFQIENVVLLASTSLFLVLKFQVKHLILGCFFQHQFQFHHHPQLEQ